MTDLLPNIADATTAHLAKVEDVCRRAGINELRAEIITELHRRAIEENQLADIMGHPMALSVMHAIYNA